MTVLLRTICVLILVLTGSISGRLFTVTNCWAAITCYQCHGTSNPDDYRPIDAPYRNISTGGFVGNHRTHMASPAVPAACSFCHPGSASYSSAHRDGKIKLSPHINSSLPVTTYKNATSAFPQTSTPIPGSCVNVNCHFENPTPAWGTNPALTTCNTCHSAPPADGSHPAATGPGRKHGDYYGTSTASCVKCHSDHTADSSPFAHATSAGKRDLVVSFAAAPNNGSGSYSGTTTYPNYLPSSSSARNGSCTSSYCHSPGTKSTGFSAPNQTANWGGALGCAGCHAAIPTTGSHGPHVATTYGVPVACYKCHVATVTAAMTISSTGNHVNKQVDIAFSSTSAAVFGRYSGHLSPLQKKPGSGYANCENVYCHSSGQGVGGSWPPTYSAPKWGVSNSGKCGTCHDQGFHGGAFIASGSHAKHLLYDFAGARDINPCGACHYGTGFSTPSCSQCHFASDALTTLHVNHKVDVSFAGTFGGTYSGTPQPGDGYGSCANNYCHSNGASVSTGSVPANTSAAWGGTTLACSSCHGTPPSYANGNPKTNSHLTHASYGCSTCHYTTTHDNVSIASTTTHVNKTYNVDSASGADFSYTYNSAGGSCSAISCHGSTSARWGAASCLNCHSVAQGTRAAVTTQFGGSSHHVQGTLTDAMCSQCHWEANSDGSINSAYHGGVAVPGAPVDLVVYGAAERPATFTAGVTAVQYTADGSRTEIEKISSHCLGCHSDQNNNTQPFGDGKTPKQYAWDGTSVAARYAQTGTTTWGKYSTVANAAQKRIAKALSAHGNAAANQRGWNTSSGVDGTITNTSGGIGVQCYDCHNSHGSSVAGITSRYSSATGRKRGGLLKETISGTGGYATTYKPQTGGSAADKNVSNPGATICLDCHLNQTAVGTPWGYNSTFGATQAILGYQDAPKYRNYSTSGAEQRYGFKKKNPVMGGHFGSSSPLSSTPMAAIDGLCTPCHDPHGVSPTLGSDQQYAVPLLKGTWLTSPYKEDTAPAGGNDISVTAGAGLPFYLDQNTFGTALSGGQVPGLAMNDASRSAGLCLGCHSKTALTNGSNHVWKSKDRVHEAVKGWKTANGTNQHSYTCSKCHSAHTNSTLPRLMVTNCLDSKHKGRSPLNVSAFTSSWGEGYEGSGSGRIPGVYGGSGWCDDTNGSPGPACNASFSVSCHEGNTGNGADQGWNLVTPWAVATPPSIPTTIHQANSVSTGGNRNTTLQWNPVVCPSGAATQYYIEVSPNSDFSPVSYNTGWITGTSWTLPLPMGTWYWRVTARDSIATTAQSLPSSYDSFSINYAAPVPPALTPMGNSSTSGAPILKGFGWSVVAPTDIDAMQYLVEVSNASDFSTISYQSGWQSGTSWITAVPIGTWYWRVTSRDSVHTSAVSLPSATNSFVISLALPSAPAPTAQPATSYTSGTARSISFQWSPVTAPDGDSCQYLVEVSANAGFSPVSFSSGWQSGTNWAQTLSIGTWYWRVSSRDSVHTSAASSPSATGTFGVAYGPPEAPTLIAQSNHFSGSAVDVTFQWNVLVPTDSDPLEYYVEVSAAADFAAIAYQSSWQSATSWTQTVAPGTWYWRAKARDSIHTTAVSNPSVSNSFVVGTIPLPPLAPVLISQDAMSTACTTAYTHTLQWNPVTAPDGHAVQYYVQIDTSPDFSSGNLQPSAWSSATSLTTSSLAASTWYWRVKARDAVDIAQESAYSANGSFSDAYNWDCSCNNSCPGSSCPLIFNWDGSKFDYVTDLQGPIIGLPPSNIKKDTNLYQPAYAVLDRLVPDENGKYRIKVRESLPEITYIDDLKLLVVDAPEGYQVFTSASENTYNYGYANPFQIYTVFNPVLPLAASDKDGSNVLAAVLAVDDNPTQIVVDNPDNFYTVDFGTIANPENAKLLIDAWSVYSVKKYTSAVTIQPYIELVDQGGNWVKVKSFGTPAGDLKTLVVDLSNLFLSTDHRIRIHLGIRRGSRWVIDRLRLDDSVPVDVSIQEISASRGDLKLGGVAIQSMGDLQHRIIASDVSLPLEQGGLGYGKFTRYGEVAELLSAPDDKFVVMRHGDDIDVMFPAAAAPLPGMQRGFILKSDLYYKTLTTSNLVEPLPFHGMSDYPPPAPEAYPADLEHALYLQDYNTREFNQ